MQDPILACIIPAPRSIEFREGKIILKELKNIQAPAALEKFRTQLLKSCRVFGITPSGKGKWEIRLALDASLGGEGWQLNAAENAVELSGGDEAGLFYAVGALIQIFTAAAARGLDAAEFSCGVIHDAPRFHWRGFMIDSARHFQKKEVLFELIRTMAERRLNVLHWHLTDNQGWRMDMKTVPASVSLDQQDSGFYTRQDVAEVIAYAKEHYIRIVPELDVPGHSRTLAAAFPQLACDPSAPGKELCIGKPGTLTFLKELFRELLEWFPESAFIHIGGDEAETGHWDHCPVCQAAMKAGGFTTIRQLENHFMIQLASFIKENGRTPIVWGTGTPFPDWTVVQSWLDIREPLRHVGEGCKGIMSVHTSYYFDYPASSAEPQESWMFALPEEGVYMADPYVIWEKELKNFLLGPEGCLWTEMIPEWRVMDKLLPRIDALAETAWSLPERKDWNHFRARKETLAAAGYGELLRRIAR